VKRLLLCVIVILAATNWSAEQLLPTWQDAAQAVIDFGLVEGPLPRPNNVQSAAAQLGRPQKTAGTSADGSAVHSCAEIRAARAIGDDSEASVAAGSETGSACELVSQTVTGGAGMATAEKNRRVVPGLQAAVRAKMRCRTFTRQE
jgi:hypothetical protein